MGIITDLVLYPLSEILIDLPHTLFPIYWPRTLNHLLVIFSRQPIDIGWNVLNPWGIWNSIMFWLRIILIQNLPEQIRGILLWWPILLVILIKNIIIFMMILNFLFIRILLFFDVRCNRNLFNFSLYFIDNHLSKVTENYPMKQIFFLFFQISLDYKKFYSCNFGSLQSTVWKINFLLLYPSLIIHHKNPNQFASYLWILLLTKI